MFNHDGNELFPGYERYVPMIKLKCFRCFVTSLFSSPLEPYNRTCQNTYERAKGKGRFFAYLTG